MRTMQQQLIEKGLTDGSERVKEKPKGKTNKRPKETLSRREWEEIMGVNRDTYQKQGGVYRRKR